MLEWVSVIAGTCLELTLNTSPATFTISCSGWVTGTRRVGSAVSQDDISTYSSCLLFNGRELAWLSAWCCPQGSKGRGAWSKWRLLCWTPDLMLVPPRPLTPPRCWMCKQTTWLSHLIIAYHEQVFFYSGPVLSDLWPFSDHEEHKWIQVR